MKIAILQSGSRGGNFFRLFEPLRLLKGMVDAEYIILDSRVHLDDIYHTLIGCTHLWSHMPATSESVNIITLARSMGITVIVDVDDYVWEIPEVHPMYSKWKEQGCDLLLQACKQAQFVTTTKAELRSLLGQNQGINALIAPLITPDLQFMGPRRPKDEDKVRIILRYGMMAEHDWKEHESLLVELSKQHDLICMGGKPEWLTCQVVPYQHVVHYLSMLYVFNPDVIFYPVDDTLVYNQCRGMTALAEANLSGCAVVSNREDRSVMPTDDLEGILEHAREEPIKGYYGLPLESALEFRARTEDNHEVVSERMANHHAAALGAYLTIFKHNTKP